MRLGDANVEHSLLTGKPIGQAEVFFRNMPEEAAFLRRRVNEYIGNQALRELAIRIIFPATQARDEPEQALTIGEWVQEHIRYVHEGRETFESPFTTLRLKAGDCDAMTVLILSLCGAVGIRGKMCIVKVNGRWVHIFPVVFVKVPGEKTKHRMTLDATLTEPIRELVNPIAKLQEMRPDARIRTLFA